jgi:copper homeostasis protein CutC
MQNGQQIEVIAKDHEGYELAHHDAFDRIGDARKYAKSIAKDEELLACGMARVELCVNGECLQDWAAMKR